MSYHIIRATITALLVELYCCGTDCLHHARRLLAFAEDNGQQCESLPPKTSQSRSCQTYILHDKHEHNNSQNAVATDAGAIDELAEAASAFPAKTVLLIAPVRRPPTTAGPRTKAATPPRPCRVLVASAAAGRLYYGPRSVSQGGLLLLYTGGAFEPRFAESHGPGRRKSFTCTTIINNNMYRSSPR